LKQGGADAISRRAVAELAVAVVAPALEERAARHVRARVGASERQQPDSAADVDRGRGGAIDRRAVAELAVAVVAPALEERAARHVRARVGASERQQPDSAADVDRGRGGAIDRRIIAELAVVVVAPALEERAVRQVCARVGASERQQPDGAADVDRGRGGAIDRRAVAELAVAVVAPALEERAVRHVRARVVGSERQQPDGATDVDRGRGVACGRRAVAELAHGVVAPALEERAGRHVRARVDVSERQQPDSAADVDRGRGGALGRRIIAELAVVVPAPALEERAARQVRARVEASERQQPDGAADVDRGRGGAIDRHAVTELAVVVGAPALEERAGRHVRARVVVSECQQVRVACELPSMPHEKLLGRVRGWGRL
jgi:hypothetical protein